MSTEAEDPEKREAEDSEEDEEEEETEASGGLWTFSHAEEDGVEVCVFTCAATSAAQAQLCKAGAEVRVNKFREKEFGVVVVDFISPLHVSIFDSCATLTFSSS